jgi:hypothetical protein
MLLVINASIIPIKKGLSTKVNSPFFIELIFTDYQIDKSLAYHQQI